MNKKKLIGNFVSVGFIQFVNYLFPLLTIPIISRIIGPDKFGVINFSASFIAYFTLLISYGFDLTATRKVAADPKDDEMKNKVFSEVLASQVFLFLISILLFSISLVFVPQLREEWVVAVFSFLLCIATVLMQGWLFQAMQDLSWIAVLNLLSRVIFTVAILVVIKRKSDYLWQPLILSLSQIITALVSFIWSIRKYKLKYQPVKFERIIQLLKEERTYFLSLCVMTLYTSTNVVFLGLLQDDVQVGYYTAGQRLITILQMVLTVPLARAVFPFIGNSFGESYEKGLDVSQRILPIVVFVSIFSGIGIYLLAPYFIDFLYGSEFEPAIFVCRILAFVPAIISISTVTGIHVMLNLKMDRLFFKITVAGAVLGVILNLFLVSSLGYIGSALTWLLTELLVCVLFYFCLRFKGIEVINRKYFGLKVLIEYGRRMFQNSVH